MAAKKGVDGLQDRLQWVLEHKVPGKSRRAMSHAAGKSATFITQFFKRAETKEAASMRVDALEQIAKTYGVSASWLISGDGDPIASNDTAQRDCVGRRQAISMARNRECDEAAIVALLEEEIPEGKGNDVRYWIDRLTALEREVLYLDRRIAQARSDAPVAPKSEPTKAVRSR